MKPIETTSPSNEKLIQNVEARSEDFAAAPASWYYIGSVAEIRGKNLKLELPNGQVFVAFQSSEGKLAVLSGRCSHMGADLSRGCVKANHLACPLHGWEYGLDGKCERIPAAKNIPGFARQLSFPVVERGGHVFFFNRGEARFPFPFFDDTRPADLLAAPRFEFVVKAPWYLVSANGFDLQHFRVAHDRTLCEEPVLDSPHPYAQRLRAKFKVSGNSVFDRITRWVSGNEVEMTVTNWCGNLVLVTAKFQRTTTYGMVSFVPLSANETLVRDVVWVPRSATSIGRCLLDPVDARLRRWFIREFVRSDVERSSGLSFNRHRMIEADNALVSYIDWLCPIHR